ncbi:MAG: Signal peptide peptidase A (SppA), a serine protease [uncultured Microvirga sp.]|uniref:Signal peptide peptidase A (SppA), a serine protease n=1 Tax=uncultured Microvirga sp. TaxID=412392 RepID=A0A6J4LK38_9HYPH|nr:MAG: Signal peptide peptidase A (SppA), a serine protease [uncultured Microvirga sp.]
MSPDPEMLADRRRLRRKLTFWRVLGVLGAIAAVVALGVATAGPPSLTRSGAQIARISVDGFIAGDQRMTELFKQVGEARSVSGVVISINSPGGTTTGAEELYRGIRQLAGKKPLVAFVDGTAASGGYITAIAADHIVARETSLVGSIGVLFQYPDLSKLLDLVGVQVQEIKSAPLKAEPSPFHPTSPEARAALQAVVNDTYDWFKRMVADRRKLSDAELGEVSSGRIFSGRQGIGLKLVDALGGEREAVAWLERERGVNAELPVRDWKPRGNTDFDLWTAMAFGADLVGLGDTAGALRRASSAARLGSLDGLLAVWHPGLEK